VLYRHECNSLFIFSDTDGNVRRGLSQVICSALFGHGSVILASQGKPVPMADFLKNLDLFFAKMQEAVMLQMSSEQWGDRLQTLLHTLISVAR